MKLRERGRGVVRALGTMRRLSSGERRVFAYSWWAILTCRLRLRYPRLLRAHGMVGRTTVKGGRSQAGATLSEEKVVDVFGKALRSHVVAVSCLPRSLALQRVLTHHGLPADLVVGMRGTGPGLEGHAWVEREGRVVGGEGRRESSFRRFERAA